ncbi:MAG TPA: hypothetical protein VMX55_00770 [candidate division Zixibacteria bacterium]|nr:hypothetical protein [candidate division Zixibacteria bacterium]
MKIQISRKWYLAIVGLADWQEKAQELPYREYIELKEIIENFISRIYKDIRKRGGMVTSLFWSQENLSPIFLLEATNMNEKFLKELRAKFSDITERINGTLTAEERQGNLGKNLLNISPEGRLLLLECNIPPQSEIFPDDEQIAEAFSDAFNSELISIKRSAHDFSGRKNWLATVESVLSRELIREVGPVKKLREVKEIESRRLYLKKTQGDFEKITRVLSEAVPFRSNLFEILTPGSSFDTREPLGHIIIQYFSTGGNFPLKLNWRSNTHERLGRKIEEFSIVNFEGVTWNDLDKILSISEQIVYDKIEKTITDVGGIKVDAFWTERDLSTNIFFISKFSFTEDILKGIKEFIKAESRKQLEGYIGPSTAELFDVWRRADLHYNYLVFNVKGFDSDEDKKLTDWVKRLKGKEIPGPNYAAEKEVIEQRNYRPL